MHPQDLPWNNERSVFPPLKKEDFLAGRKRVYGRSNPEPDHDPFRKHMALTGREPYFLREEFDYDQGESCSVPGSEIWSFNRIGSTCTVFENRYLIYIGGEHDDSCDPDFLIYNDVFVFDLWGNVWIYQYPKLDFPPTDFHTATLIDDQYEIMNRGLDSVKGAILIVGGLGYPEDREFWTTPVYRLNPYTMAIWKIETSGDNPGWIHGHSAVLLRGGRLLVTGGKILGHEGVFHENHIDYELDLVTMKWQKRAWV